MDPKCYISKKFYTFYSHYHTDWIANTEIDMDPYSSVIKRLRCTCIFSVYPVTTISDHYFVDSQTLINSSKYLSECRLSICFLSISDILTTCIVSL